MAVYRFRIFLEDNEDIFRDIDIKTSQTFEEFHMAIQDAYKFDAKHAASFFTSDDYWRKGREVTLRKVDLPLEEEEIRKKVEPKLLMSTTKIAKLIEQPHQRFVYVFDPSVQWSFLIEMLKIADENPKTKYPFCLKSNGPSPKQYKQLNMAKEELSPDLAMAGMLNEPEVADDEIYKTLNTGEESVEEEDLLSLEGEEGEEGELGEEEEHQEEGDEDEIGAYGDDTHED
jgi:hypothetical protein